MPWDPTSDAWLAGFADGEATFMLAARRVGRAGERPHISPRFTINLRADDFAVLRELSTAFGGRLSLNVSGTNPRYFWNVVAKADLQRIVTYFDRFPLRAKKARDYVIWREAVAIYVARGGADAFAELDARRDLLNGGRVFEMPALREVG